MHNHTFRLIDVAAIVEAKTGKTIADGDADGRYDAEVVILHNADIIEIKENGVPANTVYFGEFVIEGFESAAGRLITQVNSVTSLSISAGDELRPIGNLQPCVMFDNVNAYTSITAHFYGWKITLNP
jgi:hypothetical protein